MCACVIFGDSTMAFSCALFFALLGAVIAVLGAILGWAVFPPEVEKQIKKNVVLKFGTDQYERWKDLPLAMNFKIYFFNVSNPVEAMKGAKVRVQEVGPYIYKEIRNKTDIFYDKKKTEYTYYDQAQYTFDAEASAPLKDSDYVTILNTPMNALFQIVEDSEYKKYVTFINSALNKVFPDETTLFTNVSVRDTLFDGYRMCTNFSKMNPIPKKICRIVDKIAPKEVVLQDDQSYLFSFFQYKNDTNPDSLTVQSGESDVEMTGQLRAFRGDAFTSFWKGGDGNTCDEVRGTDATIFPPLLQDKQTLTIYNTDICRSIDIAYTGWSSYKGIKSRRYELTQDALAAPDAAKGTECYCLNRTRDMNGQLGCLKNGALDLYSCHDAPIVLTLPHFLMADEEYTNTVDGLTPDLKKHITFAELEPNTGTPLRGTKRVQLNMFVRKVKGFSMTKKLKPALIPILWLDEGVDLSDELIDVLNSSYFDILLILTIIKWTMLGVGILVLVVSLGFYLRSYCRNKRNESV